ncbi:hypothetical protein JCM8547_002809 [Rhodosporidiobolus lusitaniae]
MSSTSTVSFTPFTACSPSFCFEGESLVFRFVQSTPIDLSALLSTVPLPSSTATAPEPSFERWIDGTTDFEPEEHALPPLEPAVLSRPVRISKKRLSICSTASTDCDNPSSILGAFEESIASFPSLSHLLPRLLLLPPRPPRPPRLPPPPPSTPSPLPPPRPSPQSSPPTRPTLTRPALPLSRSTAGAATTTTSSRLLFFRRFPLRLALCLSASPSSRSSGRLSGTAALLPHSDIALRSASSTRRVLLLYR